MGDSALHDIKQLLQDVLSKVAVLEGKMVTVEDGMKAVGTKVSAVDSEIAAVKADHGRLHVAVNTVQSKQIEADTTSGTSSRDAPTSSTQRLISCVFQSMMDLGIPCPGFTVAISSFTPHTLSR
jgi:hypothetical protein